jgi:hypothetical protein
MTQTAVQWLFNEITLEYVAKGNLSFMDIVNMSQQAKGMEKEQIIKAYQQGVTDEHGDTITFTTEGEDYYNSTYKS